MSAPTLRRSAAECYAVEAGRLAGDLATMITLAGVLASLFLAACAAFI